MQTIRRYLAIFAVLAVLGGVMFAGFHRPAEAVTDDWSGHAEHTITGSATTTSISLLDTAVSGTVLNVRAMTINSGTAGLVTFYSGSTATGPNVVGIFYCIANTPQAINSDQFGQGMKTVSGSGLYVIGPGTLTYFARVRNN